MSLTHSHLVRSKVLKSSGVSIEPLELKIAEAYIDLESHVPELRNEMKSLQLYSASEMETISGRKAVVVYVPVAQLKTYRKIGARLIRELEKKFSDKHVVFLGRRKIMSKPKRGAHVKTVRPRSRTLTAVHEGLLEDIISPMEMVGKRIRVKRDGSRLIKVILDHNDKDLAEQKLDTYSSVYHKLTGKNVAFEFAPFAKDL